MVDVGGSWRWDRFNNLLPSSILARIVAVKGPVPWLINDSISWKGDVGSKFSVKESYFAWIRHVLHMRSIFGMNTEVFDSELGVRQSVLIYSLWLKQAGQGAAVQKLQAQYRGWLHPETNQT
ncbi:hypothetical protein V6N13_068323 [Hibiscus sabdariffa]